MHSPFLAAYKRQKKTCRDTIIWLLIQLFLYSKPTPEKMTLRDSIITIVCCPCFAVASIIQLAQHLWHYGFEVHPIEEMFEPRVSNHHRLFKS
jgi:hypothetical protein